MDASKKRTSNAGGSLDGLHAEFRVSAKPEFTARVLAKEVFRIAV
jgi:hypothetical protein